ncbi:hypothetical protein BDV96DRAFT_604365 [Lophiotrema nucula]|uniref:Uncharacterized protein n=1 Tax=Lophiotrema nucula TaxID=690887 RepID=A0A6A5YTN8_9PLEO|nr:hypothetical protein BDV96DRAFT_604365 [Lophiotrema nucula]
MGDIILNCFRASLPDELVSVLEDYIRQVETGDFLALLAHPEVQVLLGHEETDATKNVILKEFPVWSDYVFQRLGKLLCNLEASRHLRTGQVVLCIGARERFQCLILSKRNEDSSSSPRESPAYRQHLFFLVAVASLYAFLQSNVTGPPLPFKSADVLLPKDVSSDSAALKSLQSELVDSLAADGVAAYKLTPNVELLCLAGTILICPPIQKNIGLSAWARLRVNFLHQRLLSEVAPSLQTSIYKDLDSTGALILSPEPRFTVQDLVSQFLLERAAIHTHHGFDMKARADLDQATSDRHFEFALTGLMGKRTKFQQKDTSQLLVLARSAGSGTNASTTSEVSKPQNLDLNDDTLLESISFTKDPSTTDIKDSSTLPPSLSSLDPSNQPILDPLDSVILLSLAESIKNTNPAEGLTREEMLPYAARVLEGGSSNWQIYTQALLVRSRLEGYNSRTLERGLLQLQAVVDQVIAETSGSDSTENGDSSDQQTTFLPKAKDGEAAPIAERLRYIFPLNSPSRWELEAELAARWVSVGGLRTAVEIYERLEMWAEAALCWAATEKEGRAKSIVRRQLFHATNGDDGTIDVEDEKWEGAPRDPPPAEAPRLYCILGDIDQDPSMYEKAWEVSGRRYARAQRSLGRQYFSQKNYEKAAEAYSLSLKINGQHHQSWFALGCTYLELQQFENAVEAFSRCVQLDDQDAEGWSNLAAALLYMRPKEKDPAKEDPSQRVTSHPRTDALKAFKKAAALKHDNARIWSNVLTVAASTDPPAYQDIINAQRRICEIRGSTDGEKCVDEEVMDLLVKHVIQESGEFDISKPGLPRMVNELIEKHIKPLITFSPKLWSILSTLYMHTNRPASALEAHEKAWRAVTAQPKWESGTEEQWNAVVDQTIDLVDAYESLGGRERTEGLAAGSGELVAKDWKFKSRSAVRSVMGKAKDHWEDSTGWDRLKERLEDLKSG